VQCQERLEAISGPGACEYLARDSNSYTFSRRSRLNVERQLQVAELGESMDRKRCEAGSGWQSLTTNRMLL